MVNSKFPWIRSYDPGVPGKLSYPPVSLNWFLEQASSDYPDRICVIHRGIQLTYKEMNSQCDSLAKGLLQHGLQKGDRVGLFMPNRLEFIVAFYGILKAGGVAVSINPLYTEPEIVSQVNDSGVQILFTTAELYEKIKRLQPKTNLRTCILCGATTVQPGDLSMVDLSTPCGENHLPEICGEDVALLQYTGGTTGTSKGAIIQHRNLVANTIQFRTWMTQLNMGEETFLLAIPVYHIYGMVCGMSLATSLAATLVLVENPRNVDELVKSFQQYHPTYFPAVPTLFTSICTHPEVRSGKVDLTCIKACISGSAPLLRETKEEFERLTGSQICEGYGLSEAPTATHCNPLLGVNKIGSIGLPLPDVECKVVDLETGEMDVDTGEAGELILRSPQVMQGYHNMPEETTHVLRNGWLKTGDVVRMDEDGYFFVIDRKKELIKVSGNSVWPREVEEVLSTHPKIMAVAVAGIPHPFRGETVKAWVVIKPGETLDTIELRLWCQDKLAPYKIPEAVEIMDTLPRSTVGKILKRELLKQHLQKK